MHHPRESLAVEYVVAENQTHVVVAYEVGTEYERLGQALGARLLHIAEAHAYARAVAEQAAERRQVGGGGDDEYLTDAGQHEH